MKRDDNMSTKDLIQFAGEQFSERLHEVVTDHITSLDDSEQLTALVEATEGLRDAQRDANAIALAGMLMGGDNRAEIIHAIADAHEQLGYI